MTATPARGSVHPEIIFTVTDRITCVFLAPLAAELARRGHTVGLITNLHGQPPPNDIAPSLVWHTDLDLQRNPAPLHDLRALARMTALLRRMRPRVLHASTPKAGLIGTLAGRLARVPRVVLQVRGLRSEGVEGVGGWVQRRLEELSMRLAHEVVFNSHSLLDAASAAGIRVPRRAVVLGRGSSVGVDCDHFRPGRTGDQRLTVGYVGRLHTDKGAGELLTLVDRLLPSHPELRLLVVGDVDPTDPASPSIAAELASRPEVEVRGWVDDVAAAYRDMDILVFPSQREGLPNAVLEAQAAGVPVVGYAATGTIDALVDGVGGVLIAPGDTNALARATGALLANADRRAALGSTARDFVTRHFDQRVVLGAHAALLTGADDSRR